MMTMMMMMTANNPFQTMVYFLIKECQHRIVRWHYVKMSVLEFYRQIDIVFAINWALKQYYSNDTCIFLRIVLFNDNLDEISDDI